MTDKEYRRTLRRIQGLEVSMRCAEATLVECRKRISKEHIRLIESGRPYDPKVEPR
jgi:alpha-D-ribose 1-methylphosphonate 5-phosphate C-P lyase